MVTQDSEAAVEGLKSRGPVVGGSISRLKRKHGHRKPTQDTF